MIQLYTIRIWHVLFVSHDEQKRKKTSNGHVLLKKHSCSALHNLIYITLQKCNSATYDTSLKPEYTHKVPLFVHTTAPN